MLMFLALIMATEINKWCLQKTTGLIESIVKPQELGNALMIVTNAIFSKGQFELAFPITDNPKHV